MRTAFSMWKHTRMIIYVALCAGLYAVAISFLQTPPPLHVRFIGQLLPMVLSLLFGPAAAWGLAIGGPLSQFITGTFSIEGLTGFPGNFVLGFLPYAMWTRLRPLATGNREALLDTLRKWILYVVIAVGSAFATAVVIAWPLEVAGTDPFPFLFSLIGLQDAIQGSIAGILLLLVYRRVESLELTWWQVMDEPDLDKPERAIGIAGAWIVLAAAIAGGVLGAYVFPSAALIIGGVSTGLIVLGMIFMW